MNTLTLLLAVALYLFSSSPSTEDCTYTVRYFPVRGRAEVSRLILTYAGASWRDEHPEWPASKPDMPFGQLPVLSESCGGDNFVLAQSKAIERHLARKNGLLGSNERDAAFLDSIGEAWIDLSAKFAEYAYAKDDKKEEAKGNFLEKVWPSFSATHEKFLARNGGNGHYLGSRTTLPDLVTFVTLERIIDAFPEIISENGTPGLWKSFQTIRRDPKIEGYLKSADRMPIRMAKK